MSYTERITDRIFKIKADSNLYFLNLNTKQVIDTGRDSYKDIVKEELSKLVNLDEIEKVIFTHLHYDHIGNFDLFRNAKFFASAKEIEDFKENPADATIGSRLDIMLNPIKRLEGFKIINTPGHTRGSICLFYLKEKILFSGDTLFYNDNIGRTDLLTSAPELMQESLNKLKKLNYKILCPGHEY